MYTTPPSIFPRSLALNIERVADALEVDPTLLTQVIRNIPYLWKSLSLAATQLGDIPATIALYPPNTVRRLSPDIDTPVSFGLPHQGQSLCVHVPTGLGITTVGEAYALIQESGVLTHGCSLADLQFYEASSHLLPASWNRRIYACRSAMVTDTGNHQIPYLECRTHTPRVAWTDFEELWCSDEMLVSVYPTSIRRIQNRLETMGFRFLSA